MGLWRGGSTGLLPRHVSGVDLSSNLGEGGVGSLPFKVLVMGRPVSCGASCTVPVIAVLATAISGVGGLADWTRQGVHARPLQRMATRPMRTNLLIKHALGPRQGELIRCREGKDTLGQPHEGRTKQHQHMHWQAQAAPPPLFKHVSSKNMQMTITKKKKKKLLRWRTVMVVISSLSTSSW